MIPNLIFAGVAELADALDLGSSISRCEGSSPFARIIYLLFAFFPKKVLLKSIDSYNKAILTV